MTRIKHLFSVCELPYVWLRQSQDNGHAPGDRFYFTGDTIYSYGSHFPIARIRTAPNGEAVILMTTRTYSVTTARHISAIRTAIRNSYRRVIYCAHPDVAVSHEQNLSDFKLVMSFDIERHARARKPELYSGKILAIAQQAREYCEVMCLGVLTWAQLPDESFIPTDTLFHGEPLRAVLAVTQGLLTQ
jgi:hypothetical protein